MNQVRTIHVKIFRFDPEQDCSPHYDEFRIEIPGGMKILDLLEMIYQRHDSTLAYRSSCHSGKCGVCSVMVNGRPVLACRENIPEETVLIEPLANYPVVRDLIVDRRGYDQKTEDLSIAHLTGDNAGLPPQGWNTSEFDEVDIVTTECPLCKDIISKALKKENSSIAVNSVAELIEKLYYSKPTP
jgi:succinate dehydrogenase/fumarate reductase iron-sulfur protein